MKLYIKKIREKIHSKTILEYIFWKLRLTKLKEIFKDKYFHEEVKRWFSDNGDEDLRFDLEIDSDGLIMDLGSYIGQDLKKFSEKFKCNIYGFEPSPKMFYQLEKLFKSSKIILFNFGFSKTNSNSYLISKNLGSYINNSIPKKFVEYEKVKLKKFSDFVLNKNIQEISLVSMNIEGSEYIVLKDIIENGCINKIKTLQVQFHRMTFLYPLKKYLITRKLKKTHKLIWEYKYVWERWDLNTENEIMI